MYISLLLWGIFVFPLSAQDTTTIPQSITFNCNDIQVEFRDAPFAANRVMLELTNFNSEPAYLVETEIHWNYQALVSDFPHITFGAMVWDEDVYWFGDGAESPVNTNDSGELTYPPTTSEHSIFLPANGEMIGWQGIIVNGPDWLFEYFDIDNFRNSRFIFNNPNSDNDCEIGIFIPPIPTATVEPPGYESPAPSFTPDCASLTLNVTFWGFSLDGDVILKIQNNGPKTAPFTGFNIIWPPWDNIGLKRVVVGGRNSNDIPEFGGDGVIMWESPFGRGDTTNNTDSATEATFITEVTIPAFSERLVHLDFVGVSGELPFYPSDLNGSRFDIWCGFSGTPFSGGPSSGSGGGGSAGGDGAGSIFLSEMNTPIPTRQPPNMSTETPTQTLHPTVTPTSDDGQLDAVFLTATAVAGGFNPTRTPFDDGEEFEIPTLEDVTPTREAIEMPTLDDDDATVEAVELSALQQTATALAVLLINPPTLDPALAATMGSGILTTGLPDVGGGSSGGGGGDATDVPFSSQSVESRDIGNGSAYIFYDNDMAQDDTMLVELQVFFDEYYVTATPTSEVTAMPAPELARPDVDPQATTTPRVARFSDDGIDLPEELIAWLDCEEQFTGCGLGGVLYMRIQDVNSWRWSITPNDDVRGTQNLRAELWTVDGDGERDQRIWTHDFSVQVGADFLSDNNNLIIGGLLIVIIALVGGFGFTQYRTYREAHRNRPTIFISYRRKVSAGFGRTIHDTLVNAGADVFIDIDDIHAGSFSDYIKDNIRERQYFMVLLAPGTLESEWVQQEILYAQEHNRIIIPILLNDFNLYGDEMPANLTFLQQQNAVTLPVEHYESAINRIKTFIGLK